MSTPPPVQYRAIDGIGSPRANVHVKLMKCLTLAVVPIGRVRAVSLVSRNLSRFFSRGRLYTSVMLDSDTQFLFPTYDAYWSYYVHMNRPYEPPLQRLLWSIRHLDFSFVDAGANFGYWSALVSGPTFGPHPCLAIEASGETYAGLLKTAAANGNRFRCINRGIWHVSGETLSFAEGGGHAGRHIQDGIIDTLPINVRRMFAPAWESGEVKTATLDDLYSDWNPDTESVVIKLDVEGAEVKAIEGASHLASKDTIFLYEDHGADLASETTRDILAAGFEVYLPTDDGRMQPVPDAASLAPIKTDRRNGYDLVAFKGNGPLIEFIRGLVD